MPFTGEESSATSVTVNDVEILTPWSTCFTFNPILVGGPRRSATDQIPFKDGEEPTAQFWAPQARSLVLELDGLVGPDPDEEDPFIEYSDPVAGLLTNIRWARAVLLDRVNTGDGTRLWVVTWRDGIVESGRVQVTNASEASNDDGVYCTIDFDVVLPDGPLVASS